MAPTVTRSQSNRPSLGCGGTGASCPGCESHKSPTIARCSPLNIGISKSQYSIFLSIFNISKECFQHLVESMPHRIKAIKAKWGQTYSISMVFLIIL